MKVLNSPITYRNLAYWVNNVNLLDFAKKNKTPLYLYDLDNISKKYKELYKFIKCDNLSIFYAMKANYNIRILKKLKEMNSEEFSNNYRQV